jgi:hypothetical protein
MSRQIDREVVYILNRSGFKRKAAGVCFPAKEVESNQRVTRRVLGKRQTHPPPLQTAMNESTGSWSLLAFITSILLSGFAGYKLGQLSSSTSPSSSKPTTNQSKRVDATSSVQLASGTQNDNADSESEEEARADGDLGSVPASGPCKMVCVQVLVTLALRPTH